MTPTVALLVDISSSMDDYRLDGSGAGSAGSSPIRWDALKSALLGPQSAIRTLQNRVRFGFAFYSQQSNPGTCPDINWGSALSPTPPANATLWPPATGRFAAFEQVFEPLELVNHTPTAESVTAVTNALRAVSAPGPKYIILATDGDPDTCANSDDHGDTSKNLSVEAVRVARSTHNIGTFVIAVGVRSVTRDHLEDLANVGAGLPREQRAPQPQAKYYEVGTQAQLSSAFTEIVTGVRSCKFQLNGSIVEGKASLGTVKIDDGVVPYNATNGWKANSAKEIELVGTACQTIKTGAHTVTASFPCGAVEPVPE